MFLASFQGLLGPSRATICGWLQQILLVLSWYKVLQMELLNVLTPPPLSFVHVSVQEQVTRSCLAGVRSVHVLSLTAHGVIHKHAWVPLGHFQTPLWSSRAVVLGGWSRFLTQSNELQGLWFCCFCPWSQSLPYLVASLHTVACQHDQRSPLWFALFRDW